MNHWSVLRFHQVAWLGGRRCITTVTPWWLACLVSPSGALHNKVHRFPKSAWPKEGGWHPRRKPRSCQNSLCKGHPVTFAVHILLVKSELSQSSPHSKGGDDTGDSTLKGQDHEGSSHRLSFPAYSLTQKTSGQWMNKVANDAYLKRSCAK